MHDKVPCDEKLKERGCYIPSICNLYGKQEETTLHLFFLCNSYVQIWRWIASILQFSFQFSSLYDIWSLCSRGWSPHCKLAIQAALVYILNAIWSSRNAAKVQKQENPMAINFIFHYLRCFFLCK
jgi:hypothetical protein